MTDDRNKIEKATENDLLVVSPFTENEIVGLTDSPVFDINSNPRHNMLNFSSIMLREGHIKGIEDLKKGEASSEKLKLEVNNIKSSEGFIEKDTKPENYKDMISEEAKKN